MTKYLLRALLKAGQVFENPFKMNSGYMIPSRRDARNDFARVVGDMRKVGADLRSSADKELNTHGR